ncbi:cache domain-containing protein [Amphritea sp.]|uniref:sensor domain-containing diguanylate cyclase n=1 Tax=Amphritea sp. TaxID=1872502 RepID=UPI0025B8647B|nr:cache domain-containing protein [Amphritea sp.]
MEFTKKIYKSQMRTLWSVMALIVLSLAALLAYFFTISHQHSEARLNTFQQSIEMQISRRLKGEVLAASGYAEAKYQRAEQVLMARAQDEVLQALEVMEGIYQQNKNIISEAQLKQIMLESLRGVRFFNGRGYYFVGDSQGQSLLLPTQPELEGTSLIDLKDDKGNYFVRRFTQVIASDEGRGYVRYRWYPPGDQQNMQDKITYIARFEPFNWMIGAGDYVFRIQNDLQHDIIEYLQNIQFGEDGYISVLDSKGGIIAGKGVSRLVGKYSSLLESAEDRKRLAAVAYHVGTEGFFRSDWYQADGTPVSDQLIYAKPLPMWNWVLLAGAYTDSSLALLETQRQAISQQERSDSLQLMAMLGLIMAIALLTMRYFARGFQRVFSGYQTDLDQQNKVLIENAHSLEISARIVQAAHEGIMVTDTNNRIISINESFTRITGYELDEVIGKDPKLLKSFRQDSDFYRALWDVLKRKGVWHGEVWNRRKNGSLYPQALSITCLRNDAGNVENYIGTFTDISQRKAFEEQLEHMAQSDSLTDLPNRRTLTARLQHELAIIGRNPGRQLGIIFMDLDNFKPINDTYGHGVGDQVLITIARRLNETVRSIDMVSRVGGDEFVIMLGNQPGDMQQTAIKLAERIIQVVSEPIMIAGESFSLTASLGISLAPGDSSDESQLLEYADLALYQAKRQGRNNYKLFALWMAEKQQEQRDQGNK